MLLRVFRILRPATSALLLALVLGSAPVGSTAAEDGGEFFRGKAITYLVGNKPGGGYDLYARLTEAGHRGLREPYDAFWGVRYAIVADPEGTAVGLMSAPSDEHRAAPPDTSTLE